MKKKVLSYLLFTLSAVSLMIAIFQLFGSRLLEGGLSILYSVVFLIAGFANRRK